MAPCSWKYKVFLTSLFALAYGVFYLLPNFHPPSPPLQLHLLGIDRAIPFIPWTMVVYLSDWVLALCAIILVRDLNGFNTMARTAFIALIICGLFFLFAPTTYPRPVYPTDEPFPLQLLLNMVSVADTPNNCFPSNHVGMATIFTWSLRNHGKKTFYAFVFWTALICISTLTTKQHYFLDILGGLVVAAAAVSLEYALFEKRRVHELFKGILK